MHGIVEFIFWYRKSEIISLISKPFVMLECDTGNENNEAG